MNKEIQAFFNKLGLKKERSFETAVKKLFPTNSDVILQEYNTLMDDRDNKKEMASSLKTQNVSRQLEIVEFMNQNLKVSLLNACIYDLDVYEQFFEIILKHKKDFGNEILDFGCGNGLVTCFIAKAFPRAHVTGIDESENAIRRANEIKSRLKLKNVDFKVSSDCGAASVDTVVSVRTFHENVPSLFRNCDYYSYSRRLKEKSELYHPFIRKLCSVIKDNGTLFCFERGTQKDIPVIFTAFHDSGLSPNFDSIELHRCLEDREYRDLFFSMAKKTGASPNFKENLDKFTFKKYPYGWEGDTADQHLESDAGKMLDGFLTVDNKNTICGFHAILDYKPNSSKFVLYQKNTLNSTLQVFDKKDDGDEAKALMKESRLREQNNFRLVEVTSQEDVFRYIDDYMAKISL